MAPDLTPNSTKLIVVQKKVSFRERKAIANGIWLNVERIPPLSTSRILQLQIWFGVRVPADLDEFELYLLALDNDNPPDIGGVRDRNLWGAHQLWAIATGGRGNQTLEHENLPILGGLFHNTAIATRTRDNFWSFFVQINAGDYTFITTGTCFIEHTLIQRRWGNDAYTFDIADSTNAEGITDIDMDVY